MTTIALSKARGTLRPVRRGEALEGLSDASQCEQQAVLEGVIHMQTTSMQTPVRRDGTLLRTARAVGRWFSRAVNAIGQPYSKPEADHWADWPHFPPF
jgi:hypothetical protein